MQEVLCSGLSDITLFWLSLVCWVLAFDQHFNVCRLRIGWLVTWYQQENPCQDLAGNRTTRTPPDHHKETQTVVVWTCLLFIWFGQNHLARHSERGKKTRQTEKEAGRQPQGMDRPGVCQVPEAVENREKWRKLIVKSSVVPQRPSRLRDR